MECIEEIPLKREKISRREFNFIEKMEKELQNYQLQKNNIKINETSEESDEENSQKENNKEKIKFNKKEKLMNTFIFNDIKPLQKDGEQEKNQKKPLQQYDIDNLENLLSLCKYDIFSYARHGHYKELEKLFLEGINPDSKDRFGNTLLIISAQNNNKRILKICLRYGAQINMQNLMGNTALHFAREYGYIDIFEYLIKKGADPEIKNLRGIPAKCGLYNNDEDKLFLGEGLNIDKNDNKVIQDKYKKYNDNIINKIK